MDSFSLSILPYTNGYCSLATIPEAKISSAKKGLSVFKLILTKPLLCRHDLINLNHIYRQIDHFEKSDGVDNSNYSLDALSLVISRVEKIRKHKLTDLSEISQLISLYHLQQFCEGSAKIKTIFANCWAEIVKQISASNQSDVYKTKLIKELPCCVDRKEFAEDVDAFFGSNIPDRINEMVIKKRARLENFLNLKESIELRQTKLMTNRALNPQRHPAYLDELLSHGFINVYDYLERMRGLRDRAGRSNATRKLEFNNACLIILETREAIIKRVESQFPKAYEQVYFLLGNTGSGKTTTLCFLRGDEMSLTEEGYISLEDAQNLIEKDNTVSGTFLPNLELIDKKVFVDFPGYDDTNGHLISIAAELALQYLVLKYEPRVIVLESITNDESRFAAAEALGSNLHRVLGSRYRCILGLTKYYKDIDFDRIRQIEKDQRRVLGEAGQAEKTLSQEIGTLTSLKGAIIDPAASATISQTINDKQEALRKLEVTRRQNIEANNLEDTEEKKGCKKRLSIKEKALLHQLRLRHFLRFDNLTASHRMDIFKELSCFSPQLRILNIRTHQLSADYRDLLLKLFDDSREQTIDNIECDFSVGDVNSFVTKILESSLLSFILTETSPELSFLFHLPEMDPGLVKMFDKRIIEDTVTKFKNHIIRDANLSFIPKMIEKVKVKGVDTNLIRTMSEKYHRIITHIKESRGIPPENDEMKANQQWHDLERSVLDQASEVKLPKWAKLFTKIKIKKLKQIVSEYQEKKIYEATKEAYEDQVKQYIEELDQIYTGLLRLKSLQRIKSTHRHMRKAFKASLISTETPQQWQLGMEKLVRSIRDIYEHNKEMEDEWDNHVSISLKQVESKIGNDMITPTCFYVVAYFLLREGNCEMVFSHAPAAKFKQIALINCIVTDPLNAGKLELKKNRLNYYCTKHEREFLQRILSRECYEVQRNNTSVFKIRSLSRLARALMGDALIKLSKK